jgi:hypothetical protein
MRCLGSLQRLMVNAATSKNNANLIIDADFNRAIQKISKDSRFK